MKKTIPTSIANTLFHIEEDAYQELDSYLSSIRSHFASNPDKEEIIRDIEGRIAEKFIEKTGGSSNLQNRIVTQDHIQTLIKSMGTPNDFEDDENGQETPAGGSGVTRKLYRDTDTAAIGGVASGLAAFFGIDPIWTRLIFLASIFLGGTGILIYIVLWLAVPEAKTATQKLEMSGTPVTLESVKGVVNERIKEASARKGKLAEFLRSLVNIVSERIIPAIGKILGVLLNIFAVLGLIVLVSGLIIGTLYPNAPYIDFIISDISSGTLYYSALVTAFLILAIPLIFIAALGTLFMGRKPAVAGRLGGVMFGLWLIAIVGALVTGFSIQDKYQRLSATDPRYQEKVETISLEKFTRLEAINGQAVIFKNGPEYKITLEGRSKDISEMIIENNDGTVLIHKKEPWKICFFCVRKSVAVEVTAPHIDRIKAVNGSRVTAEDLKSDSLYLEAENGSRIDAGGVFVAINATAENASRIGLSGTSDDLTLKIVNGSRVQAESLNAIRSSVEAINASMAELNVSESLVAKARNGSNIRQYGEASLAQSTSDSSSSVRSDDEDSRSR